MAANAIAYTIYEETDAAGVAVTFDYTFILEAQGRYLTRFQNSAVMRRWLSAGTAEVGKFTLLPIQPDDEIDEPRGDWKTLNDNLWRR